MAVNKVEINGEVKLDLTQDTVTEDTLLKGASAHDAAGNPVEGKVVTTPVPKTSNLLKGDGAGGVSAAKAGTDYATPAQVAAKQDVLLASGASVGDLIKVKAVDASGKPTAWAVAVAGTDYMKTGNITKQTLVSAETTPTENYAINWVYGN